MGTLTLEKVTITVAAFLLFMAWSCSPSRSTSATNDASTQDFDKQLDGTINNKTEIGMKLHRQGENLSGTYSYKRIGVDIPIKGTINGRHVVINEYGGKDGSQTGQFEGDFGSDSEINGNWSNASGDKVMTFSLKERQPPVPGSTASPSSPSGNSEAVAKQVGITREKVAKAIDEIMNRKVQESKGGGGLAVFLRIHVTVSGIQEGAQEARAFLTFEIELQGYVSGRRTERSNGEAIISRFNDGRWVITKITTGNMYLGAWNENYEIR